MNPRVERSVNRIASQARLRYLAMLGSARSQTAEVAGRVKNGKKPVKTLSRLGLKLSDVSHRTTAKVVKQQSALLENQIDALATGLRQASKARSLRELLRGQVRLIPGNAATLLNDSRQTVSIVAKAGGEVRNLLVDTVSEFRGAAPAKKPTATKRRRSTPQPAARKKTASAKKASKTKASSKKTSAKSRRSAAKKAA